MDAKRIADICGNIRIYDNRVAERDVDYLLGEVERMSRLLDTVWHCMNDESPPEFPMREIERVLGRSA